MPWGAWVTCEETVNGPDVGPDFTGASNVPLQKRHGYVFEVPAGGLADAQPIRKAGRFAHEAVSYDPAEGVLYLTEDNFAFPSGFYRYVPRERRDGHRQPRPQRTAADARRRGPAATCTSRLSQDTTTVHDVAWVDIDEPDVKFPYTPGEPAPTSNDTAINFVGDQGRAKGAAHFARCEGQIFHDGVVYFTATQGGGPAMTGPDNVEWLRQGLRARCGRYDTRTQTLRCVYQSREPRGARLPRQRHDQPARHPRAVRGPRPGQLPARPDTRGRPVLHRAQRDGRRTAKVATSSPGRRSAPTGTPSTSTSRPAAA